MESKEEACRVFCTELGKKRIQKKKKEKEKKSKKEKKS